MIRAASGLPSGERRLPSSAPRGAGSNSAAVARLIITSPALAIASVSTQADASAPVTTSSRWTPPTRKKWNVPACMPTDIASRTGPAEVERRRMRGERVLHPESCRGGSMRVVLAPEEQEHGVAAELEQVGVVGIGRLDQLGECGVEHDRRSPPRLRGRASRASRSAP